MNITVLEALRKQAVYDIHSKYVPTPTMEVAEEIAVMPSKIHPGEPRWHDFLAPELRLVVLELEKTS